MCARYLQRLEQVLEHMELHLPAVERCTCVWQEPNLGPLKEQTVFLIPNIGDISPASLFYFVFFFFLI